ncbi:MAG: hypothetical protein EOM76_10760 [Sphingobacteriia bacterium]|nr:hypothetical protein [Sphingobacteriia bacterium]
MLSKFVRFEVFRVVLHIFAVFNNCKKSANFMKASIILNDRYRSKKDNLFPVMLVIRHNSQSAYIGLPYRIPISDWNNNGKIKRTCRLYDSDRANIEISRFLNDFNEFAAELYHTCNIYAMTANDIKDRFLVYSNKSSNLISDIFASYIEKKTAANPSAKTAYLYSYTLELLSNFRPGVSINQIDIVFLEDFETYLRAAGNKANSISIHMRNLRCIYNYAITRSIVPATSYPFKAYRIPSQTTSHRTISVSDLLILFSYRGTDPQNKAIDLFMLSFFLMGMNFKDMLNAKNRDIAAKRLFYTRAKTDKPISVLVQPEAYTIINRYAGKQFMLKFVEQKLKAGSVRLNIYSDVVSNTNKYLKQACNAMGLDIKISSYYPRHTWATVARKAGVDYDIIRAALGHSAPGVTGLYIEYDTDMIDNANRRVIDYLFKSSPF